MQEKELFEYAVIRIVPRVEREEFLNVGVVLFCAGQKFLQVLFIMDAEKLRALSYKIDIAEIRKHLCVFEQICAGDPAGGPISKLDIATRFRWLTATRSTIVQTSKVHPGFCSDAQQTLMKLYSDLVL
jgi:Protein of unknown function (DUF3037)